MKAFIALFVAVLAVSAHKGLDLSIYSGTVTVSTYQCLQKQGFDFMVIEEWVENHAASNFQVNYENAIKAGYQEVDAYAFICNTCKGQHTAQQVVQGITGNLGSSFNGMIWLDIEPCSGCWSSSGSANFEFAKTIAQNLESAGHKIGIYSSGWAWSSVMPGVSSTWFSQFPLWYAHYDNVESFNDPKSFTFAGWNKPAIKQYQGDKKGICGVPDYDVDWSPTLVNTNGPAANNNANANNNQEANSNSKSSAPSAGQQSNASAPESSQADANNSNSSSKSSAQGANPNASSSSSAKTSAQASAQASQSSSSNKTSAKSSAPSSAQSSAASSAKSSAESSTTKSN